MENPRSAKRTKAWIQRSLQDSSKIEVGKCILPVVENNRHKSNEKQVIKILALLDSWKTAKILRRHLSHFHMHPVKIQFAKNLVQALYKLRDGHFDIMILDDKISYPMTAKEILEHFHELKIELPSLILVDRCDKQTIMELIKRGASSHISKDNLNSESLEKAIMVTINRYKALSDRNYNKRVLNKAAIIYMLKNAPKSTISP